MYPLCRAQEQLSSSVRRIAAFDLLKTPYPLSRCCGGIWIVFFSSAASAPRRGRRRRTCGKQRFLRGTVGRDARIRSRKQHDLTPKREVGSSSVNPRKIYSGEQKIWRSQNLLLSRAKNSLVTFCFFTESNSVSRAAARTAPFCSLSSERNSPSQGRNFSQAE